MCLLKNVFNKHTKACIAGRYCLLILNSYSSYASAKFDQFCTENMIIPLYLPLYSLYLLQLLDIICFEPLKHAYGQGTQIYIQHSINYINKKDFIIIYQQVCLHALTGSNIYSRFATKGLILYKPEQVLDQLYI